MKKLIFLVLQLIALSSYGQYPAWIIYDTSNSGLPSNKVRVVETDNNQNKWIGTAGGLAVYNESGIVGINNETQIFTTGPKIFPNPATDKLIISFSKGQPFEFNISLINITGQQVEQFRTSQNTLIIDISDFAKGVYLLLFQSDNVHFKRKLIIQ